MGLPDEITITLTKPEFAALALAMGTSSRLIVAAGLAAASNSLAEKVSTVIRSGQNADEWPETIKEQKT